VNQLLGSIAIIVLLMLVSLWRVLSRDEVGQSQDRLQLNRRAYREREAEIERQFAAGDLNNDEKNRLCNENARQLLSEAGTATVQTPFTQKKISERLPLFVFMTVLIVAGVIGLYAWFGGHQQVNHWQALQQREKSEQRDTSEQSETQQNSMQDALLLLRTRLHTDPEDSEGWFMLGRSMLSLQQPQLAAQAFARARALSPNDPDVLVASAQAMRLGDPESAGTEVDKLLRLARMLNPEHEGAVLMTAYRHFEKGEFSDAIPLFEKLKLGRADDAEAVKMLDASIARAREGLAAQGKPALVATSAAPKTNAEAQPSSEGTQLTVNVDISAEAKKAAAAGARVFIYARALQGPPMPLAVVTTTVDQLPITVSLSDANAMNPAMKLSSQQHVQVIARVSRSGNANATPGDWQGDVNLNNWRQQAKAHILIQKQL